MSHSKFYDYFDDSIDYPEFKATNPIPLGVLWGYIANDFLHAFINLVEVIDGFVIHRYENVDQAKKDAFDKNCKDPHVGVLAFKDDVLILAKSVDVEGTTQYFFFWFDCDVSDCCLGRFTTTDSEEVVRSSFAELVNDRNAVLQKQYGVTNDLSPGNPEPAWKMNFERKKWITH